MTLRILQSLRSITGEQLRHQAIKQQMNPSTHHLKRCLQGERQFTVSSTARSLEEFFDDKKYFGETKVKSGRAWRMEELRLKSNSDLHKLWFVMYKERNMLYTMQEACADENEIFPSPERIDKVEEGMVNLENVVRERNKAYWQLEVSPCATGERPHVYRRDIFGRPRWHKCSQHLAPYHKNARYRQGQGTGMLSETESFFQRYRENKRRDYNEYRSRTARYLRDLFRRFPNADADYIAELHPEFPPGYVEHLKNNHTMYNDPPRKSTEVSVSGSMLDTDFERPGKLL